MKNVGKTDKIIRILVGIGLFSLYFILEGSLKYISYLGIVPIIIAFTGNCPIYSLFKINTCSIKKE